MEKHKIVLDMVPNDVKTVLDIGCKDSIYKKYKTTTLDCLVEADIKQDLNKNQILPFKDNSFDMVVVNQLLEHIGDVEILVEEIKRVSKKYIFVGLPNEILWKARVKFLIGKPDWEGYKPYWHKHFFTIKSINNFIYRFFGKYKEKKYWGAYGFQWIPDCVENFLNNILPSLYVKEVYYLIEQEEENDENK